MALEKIGPQRLERMINSHFASIYLTLLSIIQSVALGFLATEVFNMLQWRPEQGDPLQIVLLFDSFILIVLVWHVSMKGLLRRLWVPDIVEGTLLFAIGLAECLLASLTAEPVTWLRVLGVVLIVGALINLSAWARLSSDRLEQSGDYDRLRSDYVVWTILPWLAAGSILSFFTPCLIRIYSGFDWLLAVGVTIWGLTFMFVSKRQRVAWS